MSGERAPVDVAVGVLVRRDPSGREGDFLLTSRPEGKVYAGYWEFPGGKLEAGETVEQALEKVYEKTPEDEIIDLAIEKRLRLKGKPETREDMKKFYDFLLRQGFSYDLVSAKMREIGSKNFEEEYSF